MSRPGDRWIRWTTTGCVALLALIAGTVSYLHMHLLVELHRQPGWVAALTPLSADGMIVAASTTLLADSRAGARGGKLPWALLVVGSAASLAANVAVAQPTAAGRVIAAWPSFALIGAYELLMRQVRHSAADGEKVTPGKAHTSSRRRSSETALRPSRGATSPGRGCVPRGPGPVAALAGSCSGRRGTGHWPTASATVHCLAAVRSPTSMVGMSGGDAWSSAQAWEANSVTSASLTHRACAWSCRSTRRVQANNGSNHTVSTA
jgi:hypothetical protein